MISVCIPTYNGEKYIHQQLTSIMMQLGLNDEVIISDDGSTDKTIEILKSFNDQRIKIFNHHKTSVKYKFGFTTTNLENALLKAKGDVIFLADQDDIWLSNKVKYCKYMLKDDFDLIVHDCAVVDEDENVLASSYFNLNRSVPGIINNLINNSYLGCCMGFKRKLLDFIIPIPADVPHDIWIGLLAEKYGKVNFSSENLILYRRHGDNLSPSGERSANSLFFKLKYRAIIILEFCGRILKIKKHK